MIYHSNVKSNAYFNIKEDKYHRLLELSDTKDPFKMNWVKNLSNHYWGEITTKLPLDISMKREYLKENEILETYQFTNTKPYDLFFNSTDVGIYLTFPDYYGEAKKCMTNCCHTHLWCGENVSYIMALKMGGHGKNLGLVVTKGGLKDYSIERNVAYGSNERGSFIVHPENVLLRPGETYVLQWKLFWHQGKKDFYRQLEAEDVLAIHAPRYVLYEGEEIQFDFPLPKNVKVLSIKTGGKEIPVRVMDKHVYVHFRPTRFKSYTFEIFWNQKKTTVTFLYQPSLEKLVRARVEFIANRQQIKNPSSHLYGAYVLYDNEDKTPFYEYENTDHNAARERLGMGALMASYLQRFPDSKLEKSLNLYINYVYRELFDRNTGQVFNGISRDKSVKRLYNYPFVALFLLEVYQLKKERQYLVDAYQCLKKYYLEGGTHFYAFEIPMVKIYYCLVQAGHNLLADDILFSFERHGRQIIENGTSYPIHEVNYEQSIVAPGAIIMVQLYMLTKKDIYLKEARNQLNLLDLFHGTQPDYHLYQTGIRHWDGYWFGKKALYGDTFPHYWSALSALAFYPTRFIPTLESYSEKAEDIFRGILSLFFVDGSASCAMVYPNTVNGVKGHYYDPWANDQDFGLYFTFRNAMERKEGTSF